jgi:hypothetical protein
VGFAAEGLEKAFRRVWTWDFGFEAGGGGAELRLVETGVSEELRPPKGRAFVGAQRIGKLYLGVDTREGRVYGKMRGVIWAGERGRVHTLRSVCPRPRTPSTRRSITVVYGAVGADVGVEPVRQGWHVSTEVEELQ